MRMARITDEAENKHLLKFAAQSGKGRDRLGPIYVGGGRYRGRASITKPNRIRHGGTGRTVY